MRSLGVYTTDRETHPLGRRQIGTTMIEVVTRNSPERRVLPAVPPSKPKQKPKVPPKPKMSKTQGGPAMCDTKEQVSGFYTGICVEIHLVPCNVPKCY